MDNLQTLMNEAEQALHPPKFCKDCNEPLNPHNKSGRCAKCRIRNNAYSKGKACGKCGKAITNRNTLGLCRACAYDKVNFRLGKKCQFCGTRIRDCNKSMCCQKCRKERFLSRESYKYSYYEAWRSVKQENKRMHKTEKKGKCRKCGKGFYLEDWQHSTLHWCPSCRDSIDYQTFSSSENRIYRTQGLA